MPNSNGQLEYSAMQDVDHAQRLRMALRDAHPLVRSEIERLRRATEGLQLEKADLQKQLATVKSAAPAPSPAAAPAAPEAAK